MLWIVLLGAALAHDGEVSGGDHAELPEARVKRRVAPRMPEGYQQLEHDLYVCNLKLFIDEKGKVSDVEVVDCPEFFEQSAIDSAWGWKFKKPKKDGEPATTEFDLKINFAIR